MEKLDSWRVGVPWDKIERKAGRSENKAIPGYSVSVRTAWAPFDSQGGEGGAGSADTDSNTTRNKVEQDILGFFLRLQKSNTLLNSYGIPKEGLKGHRSRQLDQEVLTGSCLEWKSTGTKGEGPDDGEPMQTECRLGWTQRDTHTGRSLNYNLSFWVTVLQMRPDSNDSFPWRSSDFVLFAKLCKMRQASPLFNILPGRSKSFL